MDITPAFIHPEFRLNGTATDSEGVWQAAYGFIKEGEPYEQAIGLFLLEWLDGSSFVTMQTSGTTGTPKIIQVNKQAMVHSALATGKFFNLTKQIKALHCLPAQYVAGKMMLVRALLLGWDIDLAAPSLNPLEDNTTSYDFAAMVPLQAQNSLQYLHRIKKIILGGAKVNPALAALLQDIDSEIYETYGMTETVTHIAAKRVGEQVFTALPGVTVSTDSRGCLVINAPGVAEMPVITNDVAEVTDPQHFIWMGRHDNVINSGGIKLFPEQIEEKLSGTIDRRFYVKCIPDEVLGQKLVLVIEGDRFDIDQSIFSGLGKFEKPKEVLFVEKFKETGSGKVIRG